MTIDEAKVSLKALCHTCKFFPTCVNDKPECFRAIEMAIKSLESLQTISNLFSKWQNGEVDDNEYFFQMQNILLFGKTLEGEVSE